MKKHLHLSTGRVAWAMRISDSTFLPDASRPESEGLVYDASAKLVIAQPEDPHAAASSGGVGAWIVEVDPGAFEVVPHDVFEQRYALAGKAR